ncbi:MAG: D-alanine--D-alanine ligase family protein [Gemmiger sp.]|uniref:D-alanine--D-alanine ligase family protein n=1 Tax=Gemmiger sp. TaxID=2049027 RepID=UPI002E79F131|nr:D-alanine--D-alanine ligase family protein [Gemmiger sp.]MEE0800666.1 D-alanine--D-alanine ligase family protein [Gemmiger sp.]
MEQSKQVQGKIRVGLLFGSRSSEHEISCISAAAWASALAEMPDRYEVIAIGITKQGRWFRFDGPVDAIRDGSWENDPALVPCVISPDCGDHGLLVHGPDGCQVIRLDVVAPVLHGKNGEDGTIQGLLELAGIPYVGCGVLGSAVCMDKAVANTIMDASGVPHCRWCYATRDEAERSEASLLTRVESLLPYPIFVKPANAGSSVGITKAHDRAELAKAVQVALREDDKVVFEEFIDGQEVECAAIGNPDDPATVMATRPGEILAGAEFYTYDDKYKNGVSQVVIPARLSEEKLDEVRDIAVRAFLALGCTGLSRCDFFVEKGTGRVLCNELNTMPGFTPISMYPMLMQHEGLSFAALTDKLIGLALSKRKGAY